MKKFYAIHLLIILLFLSKFRIVPFNIVNNVKYGHYFVLILLFLSFFSYFFVNRIRKVDYFIIFLVLQLSFMAGSYNGAFLSEILLMIGLDINFISNSLGKIVVLIYIIMLVYRMIKTQKNEFKDNFELNKSITSKIYFIIIFILLTLFYSSVVLFNARMSSIPVIFTNPYTVGYNLMIFAPYIVFILAVINILFFKKKIMFLELIVINLLLLLFYIDDRSFELYLFNNVSELSFLLTYLIMFRSFDDLNK